MGDSALVIYARSLEDAIQRHKAADSKYWAADRELRQASNALREARQRFDDCANAIGADDADR